MGHDVTPEPRDALIASTLNAAWQAARSLPRVVAFLDEIPILTAQAVAARRQRGGEGHAWFCDEVAGEPVALVEVGVTAEGRGQLGWFGTHPDYRRQGRASECLRRALAWLREREVSEFQTADFVDSRLSDACAFLEAHGFQWRDSDQQNMVMQIDLASYTPRPITLPPGYSFVTLTTALVPAWCAVKDAVFGGKTEPEWFDQTFGRRWDFDPTGWFLLEYRGEMVGISGADIFRDPSDPSRLTGCQIEYVGVLAEHRGKRLGEALVAHCLNYAKALDARPCQLITQPFRVPAVTLYQSLGFRIVRHNRTYSLTLPL